MHDTERAAALAIGSHEWGRVALELVESGRFGPVATFVSFLTDVGDEACHRALLRVATIDHPESEDADRAALKLIQSALERSDQGELVALLATVAEALDRTDARVRRGVAWGAWTLLEAVSPAQIGASHARACLLKRAAASGEGPGRALSSVLRWDRDPLIRRAALRWCPMPGLERPCVERLARASSRREHDLVLAEAHLVARPARARLLNLIQPERGSTSGPLPDHATVSDLSLGARRNLARFALALGADAAQRSSSTEALLTDPDDLTRLTVAFRGSAIDARDLCFDHVPSVARVAISHWSRCGVWPARRHGPTPEVRRVLDLMSLSTHAHVRRIAREDLRAADPFRPERPESRLAARRLLLADRSSFLSLIRERLAAPDMIACVQAVRTAEALRIVPEVEAELLARLAISHGTTDEAGRLRATIARALGVLADAAAMDAVESMSEDLDPRVRSNAIDALVLGAGADARPDALHARLVELKAADAHRLRGAAVRGMAVLAARHRITPSEVLAEIAMLKRDDRPEHALAGAWAESRARIYLGAMGSSSDRSRPIGAVTP